MADTDVRIGAFEWLRQTVEAHGDVLPREILAKGFLVGSERVPLVGPQGIFKPRILPNLPLSITTIPSGPYDDSFGEDGLLAYKYRGLDPNHRDNVGLREAMRLRTPLIHFHGIVPGRYLATWPVFVVGDDPLTLTFRIAVDEVTRAHRAAVEAAASEPQVSEDQASRRVYITAVVRQRLHQRVFRERVLEAYRMECALCHLRHRDLLEAAHIVPDGEPKGEPVVSNGIALCSLHHAAYDRYVIGISPDYRVTVRSTILKEQDGPMLRHGLQRLQGEMLTVPRAANLRPDRHLLAWRWERFKSTA